MSCNKECQSQSTCQDTTCQKSCNNGYLCMVVLFILLVIILGSFVI